MEQRPQDTTATGQAQATNLRQKVALVHCLRQAHAVAKEELDRLAREWEEANALWIEQVRLCAADMVQAENELRAAALDEYHITGDKRPGPGVEVKVFSVVHYDPAEALEWATEHRMALALDRRAFESIAKLGAVPCVRFEAAPRAMLATDLGKALAAEGE